MLLCFAGRLPAGERYPDPDWPAARDLAALGTSPERLEEFHAWGGDYWAAVVIKKGYLIFAGRGPRCHVRQRNDCGSILKPLQATVLGAALRQKKLRSLDVNALPYWKDPYVTPFENDRVITFRQFAQYHDRWNDPAPPGTFHYNNAGATAAGACIAGLFQEVRGPAPKGIERLRAGQARLFVAAAWALE